MRSEHAAAMEKLLTSMLRPKGFRREGRNWRLDTPEMTVVVNLQKSPWDESYFINLGTLMKSERGIETIVKEWGDPSYLMHWQLRDRLGLKLPPAS